MLTSAAAAIAVPPAAVISATTLPAGSGMWLWLITTLAPAAASAAAMALPIPVAAPVTSAAFPASDVVAPAGAAVGSVMRSLQRATWHGPGTDARASRSFEPVVQ